MQEGVDFTKTSLKSLTKLRILLPILEDLDEGASRMDVIMAELPGQTEGDQRGLGGW